MFAADLHSRRHRFYFFAGIIALFLAAARTGAAGLVHVKMLPFDNKSELQVIVNMPDGTPLEQTDAGDTGTGQRACTSERMC